MVLKNIRFILDSRICSYKTFLSIFIMLIFISAISNVQLMAAENEDQSTQTRNKALNVFLDFDGEYRDYIKREISIVNYVRDRTQAHTHIMLVTEDIGNGGKKYTMTFVGQNEFEGVNDILTHSFNKTDTEETIWMGIVRVVKIGLVPYIAQTPFVDFISVSYLQDKELIEIVDKWDYWVFGVDADGNLSAEQSKNNYSYNGSVSADRVTEKMKIMLLTSVENNIRNYKIDSVKHTSYKKSVSFNGLLSISLGEHFTAGLYGSAYSRTYENIKLNLNIAPSFEYSVFPYSQLTVIEFSFMYRIGLTKASYKEETLYGKTSEQLYKQLLIVSYKLRKPWGSVSFTLRGSNYFHDFSKNRLSINSRMSLRIFEGLSVTMSCNVSAIHDQLSLPARGATLDEIFLDIQKLATQYEISTGIGINYTFGSIYSNVVNRRLRAIGARGMK